MRALQVPSLGPGTKLKPRTQQPLPPQKVNGLNAVLTAARGVMPAFEICQESMQVSRIIFLLNEWGGEEKERD